MKNNKKKYSIIHEFVYDLEDDNKCLGCGLVLQTSKYKQDYDQYALLCEECSSGLIIAEIGQAYNAKVAILNVLKNLLNFSLELKSILNIPIILTNNNYKIEVTNEHEKICVCDYSNSLKNLAHCTYFEEYFKLYDKTNILYKGDTNVGLHNIICNSIIIKKNLPYITFIFLVAHNLAHAYLCAIRTGIYQKKSIRKSLYISILNESSCELINTYQSYIELEEKFCNLVASHVLFSVNCNTKDQKNMIDFWTKNYEKQLKEVINSFNIKDDVNIWKEITQKVLYHKLIWDP